jgi:predicted anti-sigma-YlaC factor YlaD
MIDSDGAAQVQMVKEYVGNAKKFYDHLDNCESCRKKMADIWQHVY